MQSSVLDRETTSGKHRPGRFAFSLRGLFLALTLAAAVLGVVAWISSIPVVRWSGTFTLHLTAESVAHRSVKQVGYIPIWGEITDEQYLELYRDTESARPEFSPCETRSGVFLASMPAGGSRNTFGRELSFFRADRCLLSIEYADGERHLQIVRVPIRRHGDVRIQVQIP